MSVVDILKPHNLEAFEEINEMIESGIKKIVAPRATGSGKTYLMGALAEKYNNDLKLVLEPSNPLLGEIKDKFEEFGINNTDFITYQKLIRMSDEDIAQMKYKLIFLDESHHGVAPVWGQKIDCLMSTHTESIILGTSATIIRNDGVNIVQTLFEGNAIEELPLSTAIARKVLPCPHYIAAIYRLDDELEKLKKKVENSTNTKKEKKEFLKKMQEMKMHFEKSYGIPLILNKYIKEKDGRYLVFCKDKKHLDTMRNIVVDWFKVAGIKNVHDYAVYSDYPDKEKDYKAFCEDKSDSIKLLFSINMLNEGVHIKDISGVIMLRTTLSNIIYLQQLGRLVEAENMGKYLLVFDFVNNFSSANDGIGLLKEIKNAIAKEKENDPNFDDSGFEDIDTFFVLEQVMEIKEMFAQIEGRLEGSWDLYIKALKQYKERMGDCDVPNKHVEVVDGVGVTLGRWCVNTRMVKKGKQRGTLTDERIKRLDEMGFIWDTLMYEWENGLRHFDKYVKEHDGDVLVPGDYIDIDGFHTGNWVSNKRSEFKNGKLERNRIFTLEEKGFVWDVKKYNFLLRINDTKYFIQENRRLPNSMSKNKHEKNLACFLNRQRNNKMKMGEKYPKWKKVAIESIDGFVWNPAENYFLLGCKYYERYIKMNKRFNIPNGYKTEEGFNLDSWNNSQKNKYRDGKLSNNERIMLEKIGFIFSVSNDSFDKKFELLKEYMEINECDSDIPQTTIYKGEKIGTFVTNMRSMYKNNSISKYRREKLESINFIWNVNDKQWIDNLKWIKEYKEKHGGKINLSKKDTSIKHYYYWLIDQRMLYKKNKMREDRRKLFEQVVMS